METVFNARYQEIKQNPSKYPKESKWIVDKEQSVYGVKYYSFVGSNGYAVAGKGYITSLVTAGIHVLLEPIKYFSETENITLAEDDSVIAICLNNTSLLYDKVIIHSVPNYWTKIVDNERRLNPNVKIYGLTVWETDRIYPPWLSMILGNSLDGILVPTQWNQEIFYKSFQESGLKNVPPISVCNHAIVDSTINPHRKPITREQIYGKVKLALLVIGSWTARKGISETIEAYLTAFNGQNDVALYVKTFFNVYNAENSLKLKNQLNEITQKFSKPPKVILDTELISDDHINDLINQCDGYLSLCNSEGVGLGACYAALAGKIIIMTGYGGQKEYINVAHWINHQMGTVDVPEDFATWIKAPQQWAYPNIPHAVEILKSVYLNLDQELKSSSSNRKYILSKFSYDSISKQLIKSLQFNPGSDLTQLEQLAIKNRFVKKKGGSTRLAALIGNNMASASKPSGSGSIVKSTNIKNVENIATSVAAHTAANSHEKQGKLDIKRPEIKPASYKDSHKDSHKDSYKDYHNDYHKESDKKYHKKSEQEADKKSKSKSDMKSDKKSDKKPDKKSDRKSDKKSDMKADKKSKPDKKMSYH